MPVSSAVPKDSLESGALAYQCRSVPRFRDNVLRTRRDGARWLFQIPGPINQTATGRGKSPAANTRKERAHRAFTARVVLLGNNPAALRAEEETNRSLHQSRLDPPEVFQEPAVPIDLTPSRLRCSSDGGRCLWTVAQRAEHGPASTLDVDRLSLPHWSTPFRAAALWPSPCGCLCSL
jgi:hypothetical protein